jgi:hypothetical protein
MNEETKPLSAEEILCKPGDKVKIIANTCDHHFKIGETVSIAKVNLGKSGELIDYIAKKGKRKWWVRQDDIRPLLTTSQTQSSESEHYCDAAGHYGGEPLPKGKCPKCGRDWAQGSESELKELTEEEAFNLWCVITPRPSDHAYHKETFIWHRRNGRLKTSKDFRQFADAHANTKGLREENERLKKEIDDHICSFDYNIFKEWETENESLKSRIKELEAQETDFDPVIPVPYKKFSLHKEQPSGLTSADTASSGEGDLWQTSLEQAAHKEEVYEPKYGGKDHSGYDTMKLYEVNGERYESFVKGAEWAKQFLLSKREGEGQKAVELSEWLSKRIEQEFYIAGESTDETVHIQQAAKIRAFEEVKEYLFKQTRK